MTIMNATFKITVSIDSDIVSTSFGSEKIENMDTSLLASVLKVFGDVDNRVKAQVAKFYGLPQNQSKIAVVTDTAAGGDIPETSSIAETGGEDDEDGSATGQ